MCPSTNADTPLPPGLPTEWRERLDGASVIPDVTGESGHGVFRVQRGTATWYLKRDRTGSGLLRREKTVLQWLQGRFPAPRPLWRSFGDTDWLLLSALPGSSLICPPFAGDLERTVGILADALRRLSALPTGPDTPVWRSDPGRPQPDRMVFTHGDFCLPNVLADDRGLTGLVDWSRGGAGDVWQDLADAEGSLIRNFGAAGARGFTLLLTQLGLERDEARLVWYRQAGEVSTQTAGGDT